MNGPDVPAPLTPEELEGLGEAIRQLALGARPLSATVLRFARTIHANRAALLSGIGSGRYGQRWNPRGLRTAYTSLDEVTAVMECFENCRANGLPISEATPSVIAAIEVDLDRVVDLTSPESVAVMGPRGFTIGRMVAEPWRERLESGGWEASLTIQIGRLAHEEGIQAIVVPSKPHPGGKNLAIFVESCPPGALRIVNEEDLPPQRP